MKDRMSSCSPWMIPSNCIETTVLLMLLKMIKLISDNVMVLFTREQSGGGTHESLLVLVYALFETSRLHRPTIIFLYLTKYFRQLFGSNNLLNLNNYRYVIY